MVGRSGSGPTLESVVAGFYEAAMAPDLWSHTLDQMSDLLGGTSFVFGYHDERGLAFGATNRLDPERQKCLLNDYVKADTNPLLAYMPRLPVLQPVPRERLMSDADYLRSGLYNDVFRPQGLTHAAITCLQRTGGTMITSGLLRSVRKDFGSTANEAFCRLLPHLRRAVELTVQNIELNAVRSAVQAVGNAANDAYIVVDEGGRLLFCNDRGARLLEEADGLRCRNGRLCLTQPQQQVSQRFAEFVRAAAQRKGEQGGSLRIERDGGASAWAALVMPVPPTMSDLIVRPAAAALVRLVDLEQTLSIPSQRLASVFGLSNAEAALAVDLLEGAQPEDVAAQRGLRISTIRTQMRSIFAKTGTRRQADLVRLLSRLVGPAIDGGTSSRSGRY